MCVRARVQEHARERERVHRERAHVRERDAWEVWSPRLAFFLVHIELVHSIVGDVSELRGCGEGFLKSCMQLLGLETFLYTSFAFFFSLVLFISIETFSIIFPNFAMLGKEYMHHYLWPSSPGIRHWEDEKQCDVIRRVPSRKRLDHSSLPLLCSLGFADISVVPIKYLPH